MSTYLFIDGGHLRTCYAETIRPWFGNDGEIDFRELKGAFGAERCFYYDAIDDVQRAGESQQDLELRIYQQQTFFDKIEEIEGTFVRLGSVTGTAKKRRQKKVDILLAVEMLDHAVRRNMDRAVLLTGDRDFEPLVQSLVQMGVRVTVAGDKKHTSKDLARAADTFIPIGFDRYWRWSVGALRGKYPITIQQVTALPTHRVQIAKTALGGKDFYLLSDGGPTLYYIYSNQFFDDNNHLVLQCDDLNRLKLYFELQYGAVVWN